MEFSDFQLKPFLLDAISRLNFTEPTDIQKQIIPTIQAGKSVIGQSQTGTGKSHSFLLPLINAIDPAKDEVQVVITSPSRELAEQLYQTAIQLVAEAPDEIRIVTYVGGTDKKRQISKLAHNQPHVVIGTPGRIVDLINEQALKIHTATKMVIDEADMTLDLGFLFDVDQIAGRLPENLQMLVFSATIPNNLKPFLKKYMSNPVVVQLKPEHIIAPSIDNYLLSTKGQQKIDVLYQVLKMGQPYLALIFANTKQNVDEIAEGLRARGIKTAVLHGDVPARERKRIMKRVHNMDYQFMVATDLAARGIDIEGVSHVINYEIPKDLEFFVHRTGRTGRGNLKGTAITLYSPEEEKVIDELEAYGIVFKPIAIEKDQLVETYERKRRELRTAPKNLETDHRIKGMVNKAKKNVKPGYKRKLKQEIQSQQKRKHRSGQNRMNSR